jgi:predicted membrane protein
MSNVKRRGRWAVPPRLRAVAMLGELVLDLREAAIPPACHIELLAVLGNVKVLLPLGVDAYVEINAVAGSANDRTGSAAAASAAPRVRVTGTAILGEVTVAER